MRQDLTGKVALVTGSAHRVGKAIALELARRGVHQVIHFNASADEANQTAAEVQALDVQTMIYRADQSDPAQVGALFEAIESRFGRLDILVNSASIFQQADLLTLSLDDWQRVMSINLTGPFLCTQRAVPLMRKNGGGVIINICDNSALHGSAVYPHHSVAKAGLLMLTEVSARSFAPDVRVNAVIPGLVMRPQDYDEARWQRTYANTPLHRPGSPDDVGRAVAYLAEEDFANGTVLKIDGGETLR